MTASRDGSSRRSWRCSTPTWCCARTGTRAGIHGGARRGDRGPAGASLRAGSTSRSPRLVNGALGYVSTLDGAPFSLAAFTARNGRIAELYFIADRERLAKMDLSAAGL